MDQKKYYRIMAGRKCMYAEQCYKGGFIGADFNMNFDLSEYLTEDLREFNQRMIPLFLKNNPTKTRIAAGLACGALRTIAKGLKTDDIILSPNGSGSYYIGEVKNNYYYLSGDILPHRRKVHWYSDTIERSSMTQALQNSSGSIQTVSDITKYASEIKMLMKGHKLPLIISIDETIEDPMVFGLEEHLEEFLVKNWKNTELGKKYDIYEEEGEIVGRQYPAYPGSIDILAISKDKKEILVVELKRGRASDVVVGQIQRYMGYVIDELAENNQKVKGVIIALEDDQKIKRALKVTNNIEFYRYQVKFQLFKA